MKMAQSEFNKLLLDSGVDNELAHYDHNQCNEYILHTAVTSRDELIKLVELVEQRYETKKED